MKKLFFLAAVATMTLASCMHDEFIGTENSPTVGTSETDAINFGFNVQNATRADHVGADAADKLNNKFYVVAFNHDATTSTWSQTFDNYLVEWDDNSAGTTESNTSDWEYVGKTAPAWSGITGKTQTIKYWDYSKDQYDFIAWSPGTATAVPVPTPAVAPPAGTVQIGKPTPGSYAPTYNLTGGRDDLAKCYIADMVTAYKDGTDGSHEYQAEVPFTFRNLACKVRVALYETIPGYSVKDVKFYTAEEATQPIATTTPSGDVHLFTTGTAAKDHFFTAGTYTVSFPTIGKSNFTPTKKSDYNKAHVAFVATASETNEDFDLLVLKGKDPNGNELPGNYYLGRSLSDASYANPDDLGSPYYKTMLPNEDGTVLELRVNYTLLAIDGSGEEIKVYGAKAYVPAIYAAWKPNYAYTYVFKISDNTNGWTSKVTTDPDGLYPITFDAIVVDAEEHTQSTITTVATPSITTYQKGHDVTKDEYLASTGDIYVQVMTDGTLANNLNTSGISKLYTLSGLANATEADVMDALNIQASSTSPVTGRNGLILTDATIYNDINAVPGADGNNITVIPGTAARFVPVAGNTYAYVYFTGTDNTDSDIYSAVTLTSDPGTTEWVGNYWDNPDGTGSAVVTFAAGTYYRHYTNLNKVYGVKIIKVK